MELDEEYVTFLKEVDKVPHYFKLNYEYISSNIWKRVETKLQDEKEDLHDLSPIDRYRNINLDACIKFNLGHPEEAEKLIEEVIKESQETNLNACAMMAIIQYRNSFISEARSYLEKIKELGKEPYNVDVAEAEKAYAYTRLEARFYAQAIKISESVVSRNPGNSMWKFGLALTYRRCLHLSVQSLLPNLDKHHSYKRAEILLHMIIDNKDTDKMFRARSYIELSDLYSIHHSNNENISHQDKRVIFQLIHEAVAIAPDSPSILMKAGKVMKRKYEHKEAEDLLQRAYDIRPNNYICHQLGLIRKSRILYLAKQKRDELHGYNETPTSHRTWDNNRQFNNRPRFNRSWGPSYSNNYRQRCPMTFNPRFNRARGPSSNYLNMPARNTEGNYNGRYSKSSKKLSCADLLEKSLSGPVVDSESQLKPVPINQGAALIPESQNTQGSEVKSIQKLNLAQCPTAWKLAECQMARSKQNQGVSLYFKDPNDLEEDKVPVFTESRFPSHDTFSTTQTKDILTRDFDQLKIEDGKSPMIKSDTYALQHGGGIRYRATMAESTDDSAKQQTPSVPNPTPENVEHSKTIPSTASNIEHITTTLSTASNIQHITTFPSTASNICLLATEASALNPCATVFVPRQFTSNNHGLSISSPSQSTQKEPQFSKLRRSYSEEPSGQKSRRTIKTIINSPSYITHCDETTSRELEESCCVLFKQATELSEGRNMQAYYDWGLTLLKMTPHRYKEALDKFNHVIQHDKSLYQRYKCYEQAGICHRAMGTEPNIDMETKTSCEGNAQDMFRKAINCWAYCQKLNIHEEFYNPEQNCNSFKSIREIILGKGKSSSKDKKDMAQLYLLVENYGESLTLYKEIYERLQEQETSTSNMDVEVIQGIISNKLKLHEFTGILEFLALILCSREAMECRSFVINTLLEMIKYAIDNKDTQLAKSVFEFEQKPETEYRNDVIILYDEDNVTVKKNGMKIYNWLTSFFNSVLTVTKNDDMVLPGVPINYGKLEIFCDCKMAIIVIAEESDHMTYLIDNAVTFKQDKNYRLRHVLPVLVNDSIVPDTLKTFPSFKLDDNTAEDDSNPFLHLFSQVYLEGFELMSETRYQ